MNMKRAKPIMIAAATAAVATGVGGYILKEQHRPKVFELYIFDVKGGPAFLMRTPDDQRILINGGENSEIIRHITDVLPFYSRRLDSIIAATDNGKAVTGLIDVLDRYDVGSAYVPAIDSISAGIATSSDQIYSVFTKRLIEKKVPNHELMSGDTISFGANVFGNILFPLGTTTFDYSKASPPQLVMRMSYGKTSIFLGGNISKKIQTGISSSTIQSDLLVFTGPLDSTHISDKWINVLQPTTLIYAASVKPAKGSTKKKEDAFAGILQNDRFNLKEKGVIRIVSDGNKITVTHNP
jgi:competence protein ComEC